MTGSVQNSEQSGERVLLPWGEGGPKGRMSIFRQAVRLPGFKKGTKNYAKA